jgi:hypothetical protein
MAFEIWGVKIEEKSTAAKSKGVGVLRSVLSLSGDS